MRTKQESLKALMRFSSTLVRTSIWSFLMKPTKSRRSLSFGVSLLVSVRTYGLWKEEEEEESCRGLNDDD